MSHIINNFDFAKITEILLDKYMLEANGEKVKAVARGNVKKRGNILVGDNAKIEKIADEYVIKEILPRKNFAIRPPVANIDQMVIVMSIVDPIPDYMLLDMQLVYCLSNNIEPAK